MGIGYSCICAINTFSPTCSPVINLILYFHTHIFNSIYLLTFQHTQDLKTCVCACVCVSHLICNISSLTHYIHFSQYSYISIYIILWCCALSHHYFGTVAEWCNGYLHVLISMYISTIQHTETFSPYVCVCLCEIVTSVCMCYISTPLFNHTQYFNTHRDLWPLCVCLCMK